MLTSPKWVGLDGLDRRPHPAVGRLDEEAGAVVLGRRAVWAVAIGRQDHARGQGKGGEEAGEGRPDGVDDATGSPLFVVDRT